MKSGRRRDLHPLLSACQGTVLIGGADGLGKRRCLCEIVPSFLRGFSMIRCLLMATLVAAITACEADQPPERQVSPQVAALVAAVSPSRLQQTVTTLAAF